MAKKVPFDDPQVLTYVRIAYVATQVIVLGVYYYVGQQVRPHLHFISPRGEDGVLTRVLADQEEERPDGAQVWYVLFHVSRIWGERLSGSCDLQSSRIRWYVSR